MWPVPMASGGHIFRLEIFKANLKSGKAHMYLAGWRACPSPCSVGHSKPASDGRSFGGSETRVHIFHKPSLSRRENHVIAKVIIGLRSTWPPGKAGPGSFDSRSNRVALPAIVSASTSPANPAKASPWPE